MRDTTAAARPSSLRISSADLAAWTLATGVALLMFVCLPTPRLGSEAFMLPKELVAAATACIATALLAISRRCNRTSTRDFVLVATAAWLASGMLVAHNRWLVLRSGTLLVGTLAVFWVAQSPGQRRPTIALAVAVAGVLAAVGMLLEAYVGVRLVPSSPGREPGGLLGNRNLSARAMVISLTVAVYLVMRVHRVSSYRLLTVGIGLMAWALTLARTRAAWFAVLLGIVVLVWTCWRFAVWRKGGMRTRIVGVLAALLLGLAAAALPNRLNWKSPTPYRDTLRGLLDGQHGSGAGRLRQYSQTLRMIRAHPLVGVGLGNWAVHYPGYLDPEEDEYRWYRVRPSDRMASSDLVTITAEGGIPLLVLVVVLGCLAVGRPALREHTNDEEQLRWSAAATMLIVLAVMGTVDNVLLVQPTACLAAAALGSLAAPARTSIPVMGRHWLLRWGRVATLLVLGGLCIARLAVQNAVAWIYSTGAPTERLEELAVLDRGEYWLEMALAFDWRDRNRCDLAQLHAATAALLYPSVVEPRLIKAVCTGQRAGGTAPR